MGICYENSGNIWYKIIWSIATHLMYKSTHFTLLSPDLPHVLQWPVQFNVWCYMNLAFLTSIRQGPIRTVENARFLYVERIE